MIQVTITDEERELLVDLLESDISELRMEISNTHRKEYREMLKHRETLLKSIQHTLEQAAEKITT
jgi:hypothetical protein